MPIAKIQIPPGIDRESTQQSTGPAWYDGENIRFRDKDPQSIGGWSDEDGHSLQGIGRGMHAWTDFNGNKFQVVGTTWKFYIMAGAAKVDVTPIATADVAETDKAQAFAGTSGVQIVTDSTSLKVNDFVKFTAWGNDLDDIPSATFTDKQEGFQIISVVDTSFFFDCGVNSTNGATNDGGAIEMQFLITSGTLSAPTGSGFGVGSWDGDDYNPTELGLANGPVDTLITDQTIFIDTNGSPAVDQAIVAGDSVYIKGLVAGTSGIDLTFLNNKWWVVDSVTSEVIEFEVAELAAGISAKTGEGGNAGTFYHYDTSVGAVEGATRGWGDAASTSVQTGFARTLSIENFGEDLLLLNRGGPLYYYDVSVNTSSGVPGDNLPAVAITAGNFTGTTAAPTVVDSFLVSHGHGHCIVFGANDIGSSTQNNMLVRWSERHNPFLWLPNASTEAGGDVLRHGSEILGGVQTKDEIVIFTDSAVYNMRYVGYPEVYGINLVTTGVTSFSRMSAAVVDNRVYFMGNEAFYVYDGAVKPMPKNMSNYVFDNMEKEQKDKIYAGVNSAFTEILWFYPGPGSFECNRYVSYNYSNATWSMGTFDMLALNQSTGTTDVDSKGYEDQRNRTAWQDSGVFASPMATYVKDYGPDDSPETQISGLMTHELGTSGLNGEDITHRIESTEEDLDDGWHYAFYDKLIPDVQIFNVDVGATPVITASLQGSDLPGKAQGAASSVSVDTFSAEDSQGNRTYDPTLKETGVRGRARSVSIKLSSSSSGFSWRGGDVRIRMRPDGKD